MNNRTLSIVLSVLGTLAILIGVSGATAQVQQTNIASHLPAASVENPTAPQGTQASLTYQGRLTTSSGSPVNTTVSMVFKIYDDNGTSLWTSAPRSVTPVNGLVTVYLGDGSDPNLSSNILSIAASIGVKVGSDAEMTPRQPLNTVVGHSLNDAGVYGTSSGGSGVYGGGTTGNGVYGRSSSGPGVVGISSTNAGVYAQSGGQSGTYAALRANATDPTFGVAGYFTNNSTFSTVNLANSGTGQVLYLGNGYDGSNPATGGPFIQAVDIPGATLFQVKNNGSVAQSLASDGLVKAAAIVWCAGLDSYLIRSFNQVGGTIKVFNGNQNVGYCVMDFGFNLDNRYFSATAPDVGAMGVSCDPVGTQVACLRYQGTTPIGGAIEVLIY